MTRQVGKWLLRTIGSCKLTRGVLLAALRNSLRVTLHGPIRDFLIGPITSYLLPPTYRMAVTLRDGTRIYGGPRDILTRMVLYFGGAYDCWEPQTVRLALLIASTGGDVIVGGAHVGLTAIRLARSLRDTRWRVFAFEAALAVYQELVDNASLNKVPNLRLERAALGSGVGNANFYVQGIRSSLLRPKKGPADNLEEVPVTTIDWYIEHHDIGAVSMIWLDIEGAEFAALQGGSRLLRRADPPDILFEIIPSDEGGNPTAVKYLRNFGYEVFYIEDDYDLTFSLNGAPIRLWPLEAPRTPHRYFNALATRKTNRLAALGVEVRHDVPAMRPA